MNMSTKIATVATLASFALIGCDFSSNTDDGSLGTRDEFSSKQGEDNGGLTVLPSVGGGDPMPPPEYVPEISKPEPIPEPSKQGEVGGVTPLPGIPYEKEPPQQQPVIVGVIWSPEVDKWIVEQVMLDPNDPKRQEEREVWLLDYDGLFVKKLVITADGIRLLEGKFKVIFPRE
jgi:hypothetical protein